MTDGRRASRPRRSSPATSRRLVRALTVTIPGLGLVLTACGTTFAGNTLAEQVSGWAKTTGFSAQVAAVQGDLRRIGAGSSGTSPGSLRAVCDVLVTDTLAANQNLPTPDHQFTVLLSDAYTEAGLAGRDCFSGAGGSSGPLTRSATERTAARRDLIKALARYDDLTTGLALPRT